MRFKRLVLMMLAVSAVAAAQDEFQLKVNVALVAVDVGVFDRKGESITTLEREDFTILEDGVPQEIRNFEPSGTAFNALLVVDRSGSMRSVWDSVVSGLNRFVQILRVQDRVAIASFDSGIDMEMGWRSAKSGSALKVGMLPDGRGTDFYGAVVWAAGTAKSEKGRKGVILFSDGDQQMGRDFDAKPPDLKKATDAVRRSNIPFYFVGYNTSKESAAAMRQIADASGGRAYFPQKADDVVRIYEQIATDLGRSYSIAYASNRPTDGKFHKIEVKPIDVRLRVAQSRDGYYAR